MYLYKIMAIAAPEVGPEVLWCRREVRTARETLRRRAAARPPRHAQPDTINARNHKAHRFKKNTINRTQSWVRFGGARKTSTRTSPAMGFWSSFLLELWGYNAWFVHVWWPLPAVTTSQDRTLRSRPSEVSLTRRIFHICPGSRSTLSKRRSHGFVSLDTTGCVMWIYRSSNRYSFHHLRQNPSLRLSRK